MRWTHIRFNNPKLRVDPRKVVSFKDAGLTESLMAKLPGNIIGPTEIQKRILPLNLSGYSVFSRAVPGSGQSFAASLSVASVRSQKPLSSLIIVPTNALADQYYTTLEQLYGRSDKKVASIYRTGNDEQDDQQYTSLKSNPPSTLICTPTRLLDYLTYDHSLLALSNLQQLVVDEVDVFQKRAGGTNPLEIALEHILSSSSPVLTLLSNPVAGKLSFDKLPALLDRIAEKKSIMEVSAPPIRKLMVNTEVFNPTGQHIEPSQLLSMEKISSKIPKDLIAYSKVLQHMWSGAGIVLVPKSVSPALFETHLRERYGFEPVVAHAGDLAGLNIPDLSRLYILGWDADINLSKLAWTLTGDEPSISIGLVSSEEQLVQDVHRQLQALKL